MYDVAKQRPKCHSSRKASSCQPGLLFFSNIVQASGTTGFHLQQQQPQLQPTLKLWEQLAASLTPTLRQLVVDAAGSAAVPKPAAAAAANRAAASAAGAADAVSPVAAFVALEFELGVSLLRQVAQTLSGIQAALTGDALVVTAAVQVGWAEHGAITAADVCVVFSTRQQT